jgi:hypothetical protein
MTIERGNGGTCKRAKDVFTIENDDYAGGIPFPIARLPVFDQYQVPDVNTTCGVSSSMRFCAR